MMFIAYRRTSIKIRNYQIFVSFTAPMALIYIGLDSTYLVATELVDTTPWLYHIYWTMVGTGTFVISMLMVVWMFKFPEYHSSNPESANSSSLGVVESSNTLATSLE
jgi:hypothetical protein